MGERRKNYCKVKREDRRMSSTRLMRKKKGKRRIEERKGHRERRKK